MADLPVSSDSVVEVYSGAAVAGLGWPLPSELADDDLEGRLFVRPGVEPDWAATGLRPAELIAIERVGHIAKRMARRQPIVSAFAIR